MSVRLHEPVNLMEPGVRDELCRSVENRLAWRFALVAAASGLLAALAVWGVGDSAPAVLAGLSAAAVAALIAARAGWRTGRRIGDAAAPTLLAAQSFSTSLEGEGEEAETAAMPTDFAGKMEWLRQRLSHIDRAFRALGMERLQSQTLLVREKDKQVHFFANLSHELRTPLNAILGYSAILIEEAEDSGASLDDLRRIQLAGRSLLAMIDDLLDISGLDAARPSGERGLVDVGALVNEMASQFEGTTASPIRASIAYGEDDECKIISDRRRLQRCVRNLVSHAVDRAQGAEIELAVTLNPADSQTILITVTDEGVPAGQREVMNLLEETFASQTDEAPGRGLGTGIAVARSLVRSLDGELRFAPHADRGLVRTLVLPRNAAQSRTFAMQHQASEHTAEETAPDNDDPRKKVALVVDDDPAAVDLLSRWLNRFGYTTISASTAEDGLALTRTRKPDIILLDALMPGQTGYEILPQMRAQTHARDTPIVLITVDDDRTRGLDAGASDFVRKPIREAELRDLVAVYDKDMQGDVLIIEDDDDSAELLSRNLRRLGFTPHRANDGMEGFELLRSIQPRAIVLDLNMPRINGFEFIERVSAEKPGHEIPMLVFSGKDLSLIEYRKLNEAGCHFFLKGSASPREIVTTLRELVA